MHELTDQLELVFDAKILAMTLHTNTAAQYNPGIYGGVYSQLSSPHTSVTVRLMKRSGAEGHDLINTFAYITLHARIIQVRYKSSFESPYPNYTVEFVVSDLETFTKDLINYCWNHFSEEFTRRLDKVLEEE